MKKIYYCLGLCIVNVLISNLNVLAQDDQTLREQLMRLFSKNIVIHSINNTPMKNVYEVNTDEHTFYIYSSEKFLMFGDVYDTVLRESLRDQKKNKKVAKLLHSIPESEMIVFGDKFDRYITVFTDLDCQYCRRFHLTVPELNKNNLKVRYLMFPMAGINSESYKNAVSIWCADNPGKSMTEVMESSKQSLYKIEEKQCQNDPVKAQYEIGKKIGVPGTPTIILENGKMIVGYLPPEEVLSAAGISQQLQKILP